MSSTSPETRTRILDAALDLLRERGGRAVRMGDIARAAGLSRQAVYLHFPSRAELLVAATRHLDRRLDVDARLAPSRAAATGAERLDRYIEAWGAYLPHIHPVARALLQARDGDEAAAAAWDDRMAAMRDGCRAAIETLHADGTLAPEWNPVAATDALWTLLSVPGWESLTLECGWSVDQYVERMKRLARRAFVAGPGGLR